MMVKFLIRLPRSQDEWIRREAERLEKSKAQVIRDAVSRSMAEQRRMAA